MSSLTAGLAELAQLAELAGLAELLEILPSTLPDKTISAC